MYKKSWSYAILFLRYGMWWMLLLFFVLGYVWAMSRFEQNFIKMKKTPEDTIILHSVPKIMIRWCEVPKIWCATDGWTDRQTDRKSEILRWVPHLKNNVKRNRPVLNYWFFKIDFSTICCSLVLCSSKKNQVFPPEWNKHWNWRRISLLTFL